MPPIFRDCENESGLGGCGGGVIVRHKSRPVRGALIQQIGRLRDVVDVGFPSLFVDPRFDVRAVIHRRGGLAAVADIPQRFCTVEIVSVKGRAEVQFLPRHVVRLLEQIHGAGQASLQTRIRHVEDHGRIVAGVVAPGSVKVIGHHVDEVEDRG